MHGSSFETLIELKHYKTEERWYPTSIDDYRMAFKIDMTIENSAALKSNLAYSMQYLEFLEKEMAELKLSSVIYSMLVKTYVVTGMSILEGLFSNIVKSKGWWKKTDLESLGTTISNETRFGDVKYVVKTELLKKVPNHDTRMDLDALIKIMTHHHEAIGVNHLVYPALGRLKTLRNRVHIQMLESNTDHDYNAFNDTVKREMGEILYTVLSSSNITDYPRMFEFLKVNICDE